MKKMLVLTGLCLMMFQPLLAESLILDSGDTQDWVRIMYQGYPKYQDTMIRPTALLKFQTQDIPKNAVIEYAVLGYRALSCTSGATITVSYVSDDSWSFDRTDAEDLYLWPVEGTLGTYPTG
ncbi:MAG: hypothetical protein ACYTG7_20415 [Planctomycetota bacterium]|jgi:hypothetical protein